MNALRKTLPPLPDCMKGLPVDDRGYPIPFFVKWIDGKPDFRVLDNEKFIRAITEKRCSVCGNPLGRYKSFVGGPMNVLQMISGEPPMHLACATFSVKACPFLLLPMSKRRNKDLPEEVRPVGEESDIFFEDNPGISAIFTCTRFRPSPTGRVFKFDDMSSIQWFTQGREATPEEIRDALERARDRLTKTLQAAEHRS